jgi:hypothetical protein
MDFKDRIRLIAAQFNQHKAIFSLSDSILTGSLAIYAGMI